MTAQEILAFITEIGIVPVVRTPSAESAIAAIEAIYRGGVRAAEVTMTVPGAVKALEKLADADILLVQGLPPASDYRFKHALIQDAA